MYGSGMYGGGGGYGGGMYGGGGGMYGMQGGGMFGPGVDPNDPNSLTNSFSQGTQATFSMIENLVGAFGGVAQMLESTYMATRSSFFGKMIFNLWNASTWSKLTLSLAIISVAEQFSNLRTTLGSILGIFTLLRWFRTIFAKLTGRPPPADATSLTPSAFASFQGFASSSPGTLPNGQPIPSKKPFLFFVAAVVGLPYLMTKLVRSMVAQSQQQQDGQPILGPDGQPLPDQFQQRQLPMDPSKLEFCKVLYDYPPANQPPLLSQVDIKVKADDLVAVLSKTDPAGNASDWWQCRTRDHQIGYLPGLYLEPFIKKPVEQIETHSRVNTLSSVLGGEDDAEGSSRSNSLKVEAKSKVDAVG